MTEDVIDGLNVRVTAAIRRAERLSDENSPHAISAYAEVSSYEEALAALLPADDVEGAVARVGAVTAALHAHLNDRALSLAERFKSDRALADERRLEIDNALASIPGEPAGSRRAHTTGLIFRRREDLRRPFEVESRAPPKKAA